MEQQKGGRLMKNLVEDGKAHSEDGINLPVQFRRLYPQGGNDMADEDV